MFRTASTNTKGNSVFVNVGTDHDHFGLKRKSDDSPAKQLDNIVDHLLRRAQATGARTGRGASILDLGAGRGGPARRIATLTEASIVCIDNDEAACAANSAALSQRGLADRITVREHSAEKLPEEWTGEFDLVVSLDALCFVHDTRSAMGEVARVLREGGVLAAVDVVASPRASRETLQPFEKRNGLAKLRTPREWEKLAEAEGLVVLRTHHLGCHAASTLAAAAQRGRDLSSSDDCYDKEAVLQTVARIEEDLKLIKTKESFSWGLMVALKPFSDARDGIVPL